MNENQIPEEQGALNTFRSDQLEAHVYSDRASMGRAAARHVGSLLRRLLGEQDEVRLVVGSAPSQDEFFAALLTPEIAGPVDWSRIVAFHMDEYIGLPADHPQSFRHYQQIHFAGQVALKQFHPILGEAPDPAAECRRLNSLLGQAPIDLVCLGIGENGHLAFNDPPVADFDDPVYTKIVELDAVCRQQQVNDGCFPALEDVPATAITLTLKVFREARHLSGVVPAKTKAQAVRDTLQGPISTACPATLMRRHPSARLFLDPDSASLLG